MGAIWGDPYTIGGNGGGVSPQRGAKVAAENRGFTDLRCLAPQGGARWHPLYWGGGRFIANLLVNLLVSLVNVLVVI